MEKLAKAVANDHRTAHGKSKGVRGFREMRPTTHDSDGIYDFAYTEYRGDNGVMLERLITEGKEDAKLWGKLTPNQKAFLKFINIHIDKAADRYTKDKYSVVDPYSKESKVSARGRTNMSMLDIQNYAARPITGKRKTANAKMEKGFVYSFRISFIGYWI